MGYRKNILIVDDSEVDRKVLEEILSHDFEVFQVNSGYAALNFLQDKEVSFDAVLLDISMPLLDGFSVLDLMEKYQIKEIPVFLITSEATLKNIQKAAQYNVAEFIRKPFDGNAILKRLKAKLGMT